ncbi:trypsin-like serine protease [Corynebacterium lowii]|uniref:Serine protease n=1 Tax=Corynebacterium lowii TaxID=1544413 RepID=A0A0Q1AH91_9CORY|nr:trypsin-like serine protease [Corynebacterium lowii]KQB86036.1 Trypsin [Corynebacterium lowii]MDP9850533.1 hypothetical protein [Corynebacterium lowii]
MKLTRYLLAAAVALTTAAAPAHAATSIGQATAIKAVEGYRCTLSVVDAHTAYTAQHCGMGTWNVGDTIYTLEDRQPIGTIAALGSDLPYGQQLDAVKVDLLPGTRVVGHVGRGDSASLRNGDSVRFQAPGNDSIGFITYDAPRHLAVGDDSFPSLLINASITTYGGNSGGPLLDGQNNVVGVLSGGSDDNDALFTPLHLIEQGLG